MSRCGFRRTFYWDYCRRPPGCCCCRPLPRNPGLSPRQRGSAGGGRWVSPLKRLGPLGRRAAAAGSLRIKEKGKETCKGELAASRMSDFTLRPLFLSVHSAGPSFCRAFYLLSGRLIALPLPGGARQCQSHGFPPIGFRRIMG